MNICCKAYLSNYGEFLNDLNNKNNLILPSQNLQDLAINLQFVENLQGLAIVLDKYDNANKPSPQSQKLFGIKESNNEYIMQTRNNLHQRQLLNQRANQKSSINTLNGD